MHKNYAKLFIILCIAQLCLLIGTLVALSMIEDRYFVFGMLTGRYTSKKYAQGIPCYNEPNQAFAKLVFLRENPKKYEAYIMGSSRVGNIPNELISAYKTYNLTYSQGLPYEHLHNLFFLLKHGVQIQAVLLGLDDASYLLDPFAHRSQLLRVPHPETTGESWLSFLRKYVRSGNYNFTERRQLFDIMNTGRPQIPEAVIQAILENPDAHRSKALFAKPAQTGVEQYREETLSEIKQIRELCENKGITLVVFINPIHVTTYKAGDINTFNRFKKELARIVPYYDFAYINKITSDSFNYYDTSHYRENVGAMILEKLGWLDTRTAPEAFGKYVTELNIYEHIDFLEHNMDAMINDK